MRDFFYCLVFPHPQNNHRARFLHPKTVFVLIAFFIFSSLFFSSSYNPFGERLRAFADISLQELLVYTNQTRAENGLPALSNNPQLTSAAEKKIEDMFAKNYWSHNSPDGTTPWFFIKQEGYDYVYAGENLARGFTSSRDVVNAWMASPTHKDNLLSPNFRDVGFAVKSGTINSEQTFLVAQEFGSTNSLPVAQKTELKKDQEPKKVLGFEMSTLYTSKPNLSLSSKFAIVLILSFVGIFLIDLIIIQRKKVVRFVGHNLDHMIFLCVMVCIIGVLGTGAII